MRKLAHGCFMCIYFIFSLWSHGTRKIVYLCVTNLYTRFMLLILN